MVLLRPVVAHLLEGRALHNLDVREQLIPLLRVFGRSVNQRIYSGIVQPGRAAHSDAPLGAEVVEQDEGGMVVRPDLHNPLAAARSQRRQEGVGRWAFLLLIQRGCCLLQFPRRPSRQAPR